MWRMPADLFTAGFATLDELMAGIEQRVADRDQHFAESVRRCGAADADDVRKPERVRRPGPESREGTGATCPRGG